VDIRPEGKKKFIRRKQQNTLAFKQGMNANIAVSENNTLIFR
jgi:hypothetical protein